MYHIFEKDFKSENEFEEYVYSLIDDYTKNTKNDIDTLNVIRYIDVLKTYIETKCPKRERNFLRLISLVTASIDSNGSGMTTVDLTFANLLSTNPSDFLSTKYALVKTQVDNDTIYDILLFLKYNLLTTMATEAKTSSNIQEKYKKEIGLIDEGIEEIEKVLEFDEDEEDEEEYDGHEIPENLKEKIEKFINEYKPYQIKEYLDKYIIGQEEAKKTVSTTIYNHMLNLIHPELSLKKNNLLMVGPSGCGKTEIMRVLSKILPVPISIFDTSGMSQNGWKGDKKVKDAVKELVIKTNSVENAECGIIFLDEFDKMCRPAFTSHNENVSVHIQGEILAMIEGSNVEVSMVGEDIIGMTELVNTKNILFICAGAFEGIEDIIKKERNKSSNIGFGGISKETEIQVTAKDITKEIIMKFGVTPELAGRLTITTALNKLTKDDMFNILTNCENNVIAELHNLIKVGYNTELEITEGALHNLINKLCMDVGARGLRTIVFEFFDDVMFELSYKTNVSKVLVNDNLEIQYITKKSSTKQKAKSK